MNAKTFFRILNRKIERYEKLARNPFEIPQAVTIVWFEDENPQENSRYFEGDSFSD